MLEPTLSLVVPTRNEQENVRAVVERISHALGATPHEILFVDDSDDATPQVVAAVMATDPQVRLIHREGAERAGGLATAVVAGIRQARGTFIGVIDGDLQHPPEALPQLMDAAERADIVVASRYIPGGSSGGLDGPYRQAVSRGSKVVAGTLFHRVRACTDPMSGFFLFRRTVVDGVELRPIGFKILLEILVRGKWTRLAEVPYRFAEREAGQSKASVHQGVEYLRHLRELRLHGKRGDGPVRYERERPELGPDDPQPLDDELALEPVLVGARGRRLLWTIAIMALVLRLVLLPIGHWWDLTTDYNTFIDLARNHSPYDTMVYMTHVARSAKWDTVYEYYAYPPVPFYFYYPLAKIFAWLHPTATYFFPVSGATSMPTLPLDFYFWLKLPIWIADFLIAALLAKMSGTIRGFRDYLLNPYVLLVSGAWTFDAITVLGLVAGVYWLQKGKFGRSGVALAFGTMVKFFPALFVPTCLLFMIKKQRRVREMVFFLAAYGVACLVFLGPFLNGLLYVLNFHNGRVGGGMNWQIYWEQYTLFPPGSNRVAIQEAIGAFGTPTLGIVLLLTYWYVFKAEMSFNRMLLVTALGFFIGSKLINEQYALLIFPFAFLEAYRVGGAWRWFYRMFWIVPFLFAVFRVPIDRFLWLYYHTFLGHQADVIASTGITGFESPFIPWKHQTIDPWATVVLGVAFFVLSVVAMLWPVRPPRPRHLPRSSAYAKGRLARGGPALEAAVPTPALASAGTRATVAHVIGDEVPTHESLDALETLETLGDDSVSSPLSLGG